MEVTILKFRDGESSTRTSDPRTNTLDRVLFEKSMENVLFPTELRWGRSVDRGKLISTDQWRQQRDSQAKELWYHDAPWCTTVHVFSLWESGGSNLREIRSITNRLHLISWFGWSRINRVTRIGIRRSRRTRPPRLRLRHALAIYRTVARQREHAAN